MSDFYPPTPYRCHRCNTPAEVIKQGAGITELRCPKCHITLGMGFDHTQPAPAPTEGEG